MNDVRQAGPDADCTGRASGTARMALGRPDRVMWKRICERKDAHAKSASTTHRVADTLARDAETTVTIGTQRSMGVRVPAAGPTQLVGRATVAQQIIVPPQTRIDQALIAGDAVMSHDAPSRTVGPFDSHADVGNIKLSGAANYDADQQQLEIAGAGSNMWFGKDEFHWAWKRLNGDFILRAEARFVGEGVEEHRKLGWTVRANGNTDSPHVSAVVHGDGLTSLQFRRSTGNDTGEVKTQCTGADVIQLQRLGQRYVMSVARRGEGFESVEISDLELGNEVYVGLFVCSHNADVLEKAIFHNVRIILPAKDDFVPYRDYIGSRLETVDVQTGERRILGSSPKSLQAPNWTADGKTLIYNSDGGLFSL